MSKQIIRVGIIFLAMFSVTLKAATPSLKKRKALDERILYFCFNGNNKWQIESFTEIFERAKDAGYTHIMLHDTKFEKLHLVGKEYFENLKEITAAIRELKMKVGVCVFIVGDARGTTDSFPNLAEGFVVENAPFAVKGTSVVPETDTAFDKTNLDFETPKGNNYDRLFVQDMPGKITFADSSLAKVGKCSIRIKDPKQDKHGRARIGFKIKGPKRRAISISFWIKTKGLRRAKNVKMLFYSKDWELRGKRIKVKSTQDWTRHQVLFNTMDFDEIDCYLGIWGGTEGEMWIDDIRIEESGFAGAIYRESSPVSVVGKDGTKYVKGKDFQPAKAVAAGDKSGRNVSPFVITPKSRIRDGEKLRISYMHSFDVCKKGASLCLSSPETMQHLRKSAESLQKLLNPDVWFMYHDEIRVINRCPYCLSLKKTPGEILAENVRRCTGMLKEITPGKPVYVWSDMFDPFHNIRDNYYLVNGSLKKSWAGVAKDVIIMKWSLNSKGVDFFTKNGWRVIMAGYYDVADARANAKKWVSTCGEMPNIIGAMYSSWSNNYKHIEAFSEGLTEGLKELSQ